MDMDKLDVRAYVDNPYTGSILTQEGIGYSIAIDFKLITGMDSENHLTFRPLKPGFKSGIYIVWKKYQYFSNASETFLNALKET